MQRRAWFVWEQGPRCPVPAVYYDELPRKSETGKKYEYLREIEIPEGTANSAYFFHDETPDFTALMYILLPPDAPYTPPKTPANVLPKDEPNAQPSPAPLEELPQDAVDRTLLYGEDWQPR